MRASGPVHGRGCPPAVQLQSSRIGIERRVDDVPVDRGVSLLRQIEDAIALRKRLARVLGVRHTLVAGGKLAACAPQADVLVRGPSLRAVVLGKEWRVEAVPCDVMAVFVRDDLLRRRLVECVVRRRENRLRPRVVTSRVPGRRSSCSPRTSGERHRAEVRATLSSGPVREGAEVRRPGLRQRVVDGIAVRDNDVDRRSGGSLVGYAPPQASAEAGRTRRRQARDEQRSLTACTGVPPTAQERMKAGDSSLT